MRLFFKVFKSLLVLFIIFGLLLPYISPRYRGILNNVVYPILPDFAKIWLSDDELTKENQDLRAKIAQFESERNYADSLFEENDKLRQALGMEKVSGYDSVVASVSVRSPLTAKFRFIIDKGESSGIEIGMPVLVGGALLGRVVETGSNHAVVGTMAMQSLNVYCRIKGTDYTGKLSGEAKGSSDGNIFCELTWLPRDVMIKPGVLVVTAGLAENAEEINGTVPKNLRVGVIREVYKNEKYQTAVVELTASWRNFEYVVILKKKKIK